MSLKISAITGFCFSAVLIVGMFILTPTSALAAEFGSLRVGDDYSFDRAPAGSNYRWCEDSCRNDPRCKSWTFIRPTRQCRLKHSIAPARRNKCCVSGVKRVVNEGSREFRCARYARKALGQADENVVRRCGFRGTRWGVNFKAHYRWCLRANQRTRQAENAARVRSLNRCEENRDRFDRVCDRFAQIAVEQNDTNNVRKCGFRNRNQWHSDYDRHYRWCRNRRPRDRDRENKTRETKLSACIGRGGGPYNKSCDDYSKSAVAQYQSGLKNRCGFRGPRWNQRFATHYQWCLKSGPWERRSETRARKRAVDRCIAQGGEKGEGQKACDHFARISVVQGRSNSKHNCGMRGNRWAEGYNDQFRRCLRITPVDRREEVASREADLNRCFERGGGKFDEDCDSYARKALRQYQKSVARRCDYRGDDWHDSYIEHYKWCGRVNSRIRRRATARRRTAIRSCNHRDSGSSGSSGGGGFFDQFRIRRSK